MKTAEEILDTRSPMKEYPMYYHEFTVLGAMEEYKSQYDSIYNEMVEELKIVSKNLKALGFLSPALDIDKLIFKATKS